MPIDEDITLLQQQLADHVKECEARNAKQDEQIALLLTAQKATTESVDKLVTSVQGLVDSWRFLQSFRRLMVWVSVFTVPMAAAYAKIKGWW